MILDHLSLRARRGKVTLLIGPNGAGKSTALKTLFGMLRVRHGRIRLDGVETRDLPRDVVRRAFGMVLQTQVPLLSYTAGAFAGAGVAMGLRAVSIQGGIRVAIALALGAALGFAAERIEQALPPNRA